MKPQKIEELREILSQAEAKFLLTKEIETDAIAPALRYQDKRNKEFAAFVCAVLAYGKVAHINKSVRALLDPFGRTPVDFILRTPRELIELRLTGWKHRFNTQEDAFHLMLILKSIYETEKSLESFICVDEDCESVKTLLENFVLKIEKRAKKLRLKPKKSFWFLFPRPSSGSACKRMNLYLRWMVGRGPFDLQLWDSLNERHLLIPLDVHLLNQARSLKLTKRKQADWKTVEEVTDKLRLLDKNNPTRFDFALCHLGIKGKILASILALFVFSGCQTVETIREDNIKAQEAVAVTAPVKVAEKKSKFTQQDKARFLRAIKDDDVVQVRFFISMGLDLNETFKFAGAEPETALSAAIGAKSKKSLRLLLDAGAKPDALEDPNNTELISAILDRQKTLALELIEKGAKPDRALHETKETALMSASRTGLCDVTEQLLKKKAKVDLQNDDGYTALMYAAEYGHEKCVEVLLGGGANIALKNEAGKTAGQLASEKLSSVLINRLKN
jgi:uncharacterized protein (TIGR02757 family)